MGKVVHETPKIDERRRDLYRRVSEDETCREKIQEFVIPKETGEAFVVEKDQILRVLEVAGPQVADFNAFHKDNPTERFWSGRTRILEGGHLTVGSRLWSTPPEMRPMFTIITDTLEHKPLPEGARSHDLIWSRCNERYFEVLAGRRGQPNCQDNMAKAVEKFGLTPDYIHDAFNLFMTTGIDQNDRLFFIDPDSKQGDYVELYAEIDSIVAISACPGGCSGPQNKPVGVEIYRHSLTV